jgi:hypothetical protein
MASAVLFVELAAGRLRKLERMAWPFAQGSVENRHHATLIFSWDLELGNWRRVAGERLGANSRFGVASMCDYSLHNVASRPARVGDKLVSTSFLKSWTRGFAAVDEPNVAVCLLPGTELAFEENLRCESAYGFGFKRLPHKMARFRQVNKEQREAETQLKYRRTLPRCNG